MPAASVQSEDGEGWTWVWVVPAPAQTCSTKISRGAAGGKIPGKMELLLQIMWVFCSPMEREGALQAKLIKFFISNTDLSRSLTVENGFQDSAFQLWGKVYGELWLDLGGYFPYPPLGNQSWVVSRV